MNHSTRFNQGCELIFGGDGVTREEIRHMKILLSRFPSTDLIAELPLEVVVLVALYLPPADFARCLCVSKAWRERLLSDAARAAYAKRRWPALVNGVVNRCNFLGTLERIGWAANPGNPGNLAARTDHIPWASITDHLGTKEYSCDPIFYDDPDNLPDAYKRYDGTNRDNEDTVLHGFGKVAWRLCGCIVVIDDLPSKTRKVVTPPSGMMHGVLKLQALGSRLLIGAIDRLLIVWDHVINRAYEKMLPCRALQYATQGDRVAAVLYGGDVVIWSPGHAAFQLNKPLLTLEPGFSHARAAKWEAYLKVFFDHRNDKALFLASGYCVHIGVNNVACIKVYEFSAAGPGASWSYHGEYADWCDEPRIVMFEYECDRSAIFFGVQYSSGETDHLGVFDKLERRFVDPEPYEEPTDLKKEYVLLHRVTDFYKSICRNVDASDLDFRLKFSEPDYYTVERGMHAAPTLNS
ncbi:hypothetical protein F5X98DRAFT_231187 [Xylaria grammica]|nr:hypothetical protein F5X98DRAFT_231187 [Xylaria grammica]